MKNEQEALALVKKTMDRLGIIEKSYFKIDAWIGMINCQDELSFDKDKVDGIVAMLSELKGDLKCFSDIFKKEAKCVGVKDNTNVDYLFESVQVIEERKYGNVHA